MKVVLLKSISGLGRSGEIKDVKSGYGRNYLIPNGLANILTQENLAIKQIQEKKEERLKISLKNDKIQLAKKINSKLFIIKVKANNNGTIYSKISAKIISDFLQKQGYKINQGEIILNDPIKKVGEYDILLNLGDEKALIKIQVKNE